MLQTIYGYLCVILPNSNIHGHSFITSCTCMLFIEVSVVLVWSVLLIGFSFVHIAAVQSMII